MSHHLEEETAAEHIRNAQELIRGIVRCLRILHFHEYAAAIEAADLRLIQALHAIERNRGHA